MRGNSSATRFSIGAAALFIAAPAIIFYSILVRHIVNVPMNDDYYALLDFLNHIREAPNLSAKAYYFLISQYNQYKLFFEHALFWTQLELSGHLDLTVLCIIGDSFVLWLAILLWKMFLPSHTEFTKRLAFFIPIPWLLFQLQYAQPLNFSMAALQNLPVLFFSLAAIYLLLRRKRWTFLWSLACLVLAVSSSGNGLLMIPIGMLILAFSRKLACLVVWAATSAVCIAAYFYRYSAMLWLIPSNSPFPSPAQFWNPRYVICFLGSAGAYPMRSGSLVLGIAICIFYAFVARRGYFRRNPLIGYSVLFLLLTSVLVGAFRSELGVPCSSSRYAIYSSLLLIFAWFVIVDEWLIHRYRSPGHSASFLSAVVAAVCFPYQWMLGVSVISFAVTGISHSALPCTSVIRLRNQVPGHSSHRRLTWKPRHSTGRHETFWRSPRSSASIVYRRIRPTNSIALHVPASIQNNYGCSPQ
jgi:hypothetical protein